MVAKYFTVEEVRDLVLEDTTDDNLDEDGEYEESDGFEEVMKEKLEELAEFAAEIQPEFDEHTFKISTLRFGLACFTLCSTPYGNAMKRVLETTINCGSILCSESRLWLEMLYRKIGGRAKIRNPYFGECKRDIPVDVFIALQSAIKSSSLDQFKEPNCYIAGNGKGAVISLTSRKSVVMLFSILTGYREVRVQKYFTHTLKGSRSGKAKLIVNMEKNFVLIYKYKQGKFTMEFNFGVWNASGFPLHT